MNINILLFICNIFLFLSTFKSVYCILFLYYYFYIHHNLLLIDVWFLIVSTIMNRFNMQNTSKVFFVKKTDIKCVRFKIIYLINLFYQFRYFVFFNVNITHLLECIIIFLKIGNILMCVKYILLKLNKAYCNI